MESDTLKLHVSEIPVILKNNFSKYYEKVAVNKIFHNCFNRFFDLKNVRVNRA